MPKRLNITPDPRSRVTRVLSTPPISSPRGETGRAWDLWLQRLHLDKHLSKQQNTKKFEGTKNKSTPVQLGQIINSKTQKITNPIATIEVSEQKQGPVHDPAHSTTKGVGRPPKPPLWPDPSPHIRDQLSLPSSGSKQGNLFLVFTPDGCSLSPNKDLSKFLL